MGTIISNNIPYSGTTLSQQSLPIGAIIPYMGTTAPSGYLACDGGVYSISLYPLLAGFIESQFGAINCFGGDGTSTFAVPNLCGEFLRGTGANAHANQGSGGSVGEHQDGTEIPYSMVSGNNIVFLEPNTYPAKQDTSTSYGTEQRYVETSSYIGGATPRHYTSRPTNTSVLYIIKAKPDRLDKITFATVDDASEADDVVWSAAKIKAYIDAQLGGVTDYLTDEKVVGKWIDGKKVYRKVVVVTSNFSDVVNISDNVEEVLDVRCVNIQTNGNIRHFNYSFGTESSVSLTYIGQYIFTGYFNYTDKKWHPQLGSGIISTSKSMKWIFEYTKTTD